MARARNIKPGFFKNEVLAEMPAEVRLLFIGLWTLADREGRLEDRPKRIKAELFAFDSFDVDSMLSQLQSDDFLTRYEIEGTKFIQITNFVKHQDPHYREKASEIPPPPGKKDEIIATGVTRTQRARILERDQYTCQECGSQEHLCIDHVLPVSRGGDSSDENLQVLCLSCNTKKGNKLSGETANRTKPRAAVLPGYEESVEFGSTSNRPSVKEVVTNPLIPDSLIPDSLHSDSGLLIPGKCAEPQGDSAPAVIGMPITGGKEFPILQTQVDEWTAAYPGVDVIRQLAAMRQWCLANPTRKKTARGVLAFCNSWLTREQDKPQARASPTYQTQNDKAKAWADRLTGKTRNDESTIIDISPAPLQLG